MLAYKIQALTTVHRATAKAQIPQYLAFVPIILCTMGT